MEQERKDYVEGGRTRRGRRIDWEHGMAPVWFFVLAAAIVVLGIFTFDYFRQLIPFRM